MNTNYIESIKGETIGSGCNYDVITLKSGQIVVITEDAVGVYVDFDSFMEGTGAIVDLAEMTIS